MQNYKLEREVKKQSSQRSPLRRRRSALDCSSIEEEEKETVSEMSLSVPQSCLRRLCK
jgi:hypothetical protein